MPLSPNARRRLVETHSTDSAFQIAEVHAGRGDVEGALTWLERAVAARDTGSVFAHSDPAFRALHGNPRWTALMKKLGFE